MMYSAEIVYDTIVVSRKKFWSYSKAVNFINDYKGIYDYGEVYNIFGQDVYTRIN